MIRKPSYDSALWGVLEKGRLADLSQFHRLPLFDEVPLYSRESDIRFLSSLPTDEIDRVLVGFSIKFLNSVIAYEMHRTPYFAAITVWESAADEAIVPNIFVWSGRVQELRGKLSLASVRSPFGRRIGRIMASQPSRRDFTVVEKSPQSNEMARVFIGLAKAPYPGFLTVSNLTQRV